MMTTMMMMIDCTAVVVELIFVDLNVSLRLANIISSGFEGGWVTLGTEAEVGAPDEECVDMFRIHLCCAGVCCCCMLLSVVRRS